MLISLAVDYRRADVAVRERFHLSDERLAEFRALPRLGGPVLELVPVSTCNRTELYAWTPGDDPAVASGALEWLARKWAPTRTNRLTLLHSGHRRFGRPVAEHLVRIAAGLESQVLGDAQILGQLRTAYRAAADVHAAGTVLHRLFETALRAGKRVSSETTLGTGRHTVGAEAASVAALRYGGLTHARCVVVGCGKTGERIARQLLKLGAKDIVVVNRTPGRARALAAALNVRAAPYAALHLELALADVGIVATAATSPIVLAETLSIGRANCARDREPLLLVDIALPRNIAPSVGELPGVTLVDLDTLHPPVARAEEARAAAVPKAESICATELASFHDWLAAASAREAIRPLREALAEVCRREVAFAAGPLVADHAADRIVAKLLARPMSALRAAIARGERVDDVALTLDSLFALTPGAPLPRNAAESRVFAD